MLSRFLAAYSVHPTSGRTKLVKRHTRFPAVGAGASSGDRMRFPFRTLYASSCSSSLDYVSPTLVGTITLYGIHFCPDLTGLVVVLEGTAT